MLVQIIFFQFLLILFNLSDAIDTLTINRPLSDGKTIISSGGIFELGFFSPDNNSKNRYLGIWYKKVTKQPVVWIANRDVPLNDTNGTFMMTEQAKLTLFNGENTSVWSTNTSKLTNNPMGQLLDSGNLVVRDAADGNPEKYLWQSFDCPTDTILPGMKFGLDLVRGIDMYLQFPKSSIDPSRGEFIFKTNPNGSP